MITAGPDGPAVIRAFSKGQLWLCSYCMVCKEKRRFRYALFHHIALCTGKIDRKRQETCEFPENSTQQT